MPGHVTSSWINSGGRGSGSSVACSTSSTSSSSSSTRCAMHAGKRASNSRRGLRMSVENVSSPGAGGLSPRRQAVAGRWRTRGRALAAAAAAADDDDDGIPEADASSARAGSAWHRIGHARPFWTKKGRRTTALSCFLRATDAAGTNIRNSVGEQINGHRGRRRPSITSGSELAATGGARATRASSASAPLVAASASAADDRDPQIASPTGVDVLDSPLERMRQLGLGWVGIVIEYEGVLVESTFDSELAAWKTLAAELEVGREPNEFALRRAQGMLPEHVISQVLCWTRNPERVRAIVARFRGLVEDALSSGGGQAMMPGVSAIIRSLCNTGDVAFAVVSSLPTARVREGLRMNGILDIFKPPESRRRAPAGSGTAAVDDDGAIILGADDVMRGRPDPEAYMVAATMMKRPPNRCIVFGNTNACIEAARDAGMKCVGVATTSPMYELGSADLVVRRLDDACILNIKKLISEVSDVADMNGGGEDELEPMPQMEREEETERRLPSLYDYES